MSITYTCDACGQPLDRADRYSLNVSAPSRTPNLGNTQRLLDAVPGSDEQKQLMAQVAADVVEAKRPVPRYGSYDLHAACFDTRLAAAFAALRKDGDS